MKTSHCIDGKRLLLHTICSERIYLSLSVSVAVLGGSVIIALTIVMRPALLLDEDGDLCLCFSLGPVSKDKKDYDILPLATMRLAKKSATQSSKVTCTCHRWTHRDMNHLTSNCALKKRGIRSHWREKCSRLYEEYGEFLPLSIQTEVCNRKAWRHYWQGLTHHCSELFTYEYKSDAYSALNIIFAYRSWHFSKVDREGISLWTESTRRCKDAASLMHWGIGARRNLS